MTSDQCRPSTDLRRQRGGWSGHGGNKHLYPFERFTERAKKVLTLAQEEAERSHHSYIGTEHLLLGLLREGEGLAAKVLNNLGVEINKVRSTIESVLGRNERIIIQQIIPTSRVKKVIEISFEEARRMGNNYVGTEHLLLGLLIEGEGIAAHVLEDLGANLEKVRGEIDRLLHESGLEEEAKEAQKKPSKTPLLDQFCRDLTELAQKNALDPVIGRAMEIERVVQILSRRTKNNPALIGEPGVGKTAIAEGLAQAIVLGNIPESLMGKRVLTLDMGALGRNERIIIQQIIPTSRVKKVIELSFEEARRMGNNYVGTEHLLLGLLIEGEGIAAHVLEDLGANLEKVRGEIDRLLHESGLEEEAKEAQKKPSKTPLLDQFCRDLTELAQKNALDPVIGRAMEIERVVQILSRRTKNNPALIGEPGVGKTAIAEGLAQA